MTAESRPSGVHVRLGSPRSPDPAGSTLVEITLEPVDGSTSLRLVRRGLPDDAINDRLLGWDYYLGRLAQVCDGDDPGPDLPHLGGPPVTRHRRRLALWRRTPRSSRRSSRWSWR